MPQITINNVNLNYLATGKGDEVIVFSHGFLFSNEMFKHQIDYLKNKFRIIAFDHRGQGERSEKRDRPKNSKRALVLPKNAAHCARAACRE